MAIVQPLATKVELSLGSNTFVIDRPIRVYYESGSVPKVKVAVTESFDITTSNLSVHGYLIDNN